MAILAAGRRRIRLSNDHEVDAASPRPGLWGAAPAARLGDAVRVQLRPDDLGGWRLAGGAGLE